MRNYFSYSVPKELEEAALIDGCTEVGVFFRVIIPISRSMLAAVSLFIAVINWNDYYNYMMFISQQNQLAAVCLDFAAHAG
ncbi:MAG: ABC transporter permease subunit [Eubacteriales bacterium]